MNVTNITNFVVRTDTISEYLKEINKYKPLSPTEERDLFAEYEDCKEWVDVCSQALVDKCYSPADVAQWMNTKNEKEQRMVEIKNKIILSNLRFNFAVAKRYSNGDLLPDLVNVGYLGMCEAFDTYDWRKEFRFYTWASYYIRRAIHGYLVKENLLVRPKGSVRIAPKVKKIENDFYLKNGRKPYPAEIVDILRRDYQMEVDELDVVGIRVDKIDSYLGEDDDNTFEKSPVFNEKTAVDNEFDDEIEQEESNYQITEAMKALTEREQTVIRMAFGYGYPREFKDKEIGEKLGLTSERVRQLRHGALKKMRQVCVKIDAE
jgi:RNA polymerase primary sigma factor